MRFVSKTKECFAYNTKIIETPTTKEVYIYENPIFIHSKEKADLTDTSNRKKFDEMSAHKQYDSLKRKQKENRGRYLSKYFGKDLDLKEHKKKAFFKSQNLKVPHETKVMLTEDILHDLQKENIVFQKEYTRQIYDTNAFLSTGSCLKDSSVIYIKIKKENPCVKGESYG